MKPLLIRTYLRSSFWKVWELFGAVHARLVAYATRRSLGAFTTVTVSDSLLQKKLLRQKETEAPPRTFASSRNFLISRTWSSFPLRDGEVRPQKQTIWPSPEIVPREPPSFVSISPHQSALRYQTLPCLSAGTCPKHRNVHFNKGKSTWDGTEVHGSLGPCLWVRGSWNRIAMLVLDSCKHASALSQHQLIDLIPKHMKLTLVRRKTTCKREIGAAEAVSPCRAANPRTRGCGCQIWQSGGCQIRFRGITSSLSVTRGDFLPPSTSPPLLQNPAGVSPLLSSPSQRQNVISIHWNDSLTGEW